MSRQELYGLILGVLSIVASLMVALAPIGAFISDEPLPVPPNLVIANGVITPSSNALWFYLWKATVILVVLFFAALIASFFVETNRGVRLFFTVLSFAIAALHYANIFAMSNSISIYPLIYIIHMKINGTNINQYYLDIGQLFLIYGFYNVYILSKK